MADLQLIVRGTAYGGWKRIHVRRSLEEISGGFNLEVSELWPEQQTPRDIRVGDRCAVVVAGETVITGYVDSVDDEADARSHFVGIAGRDVTADLVDCSAQHGKGEWRNARLDRIARDLAAPFGITVRVETDLGAPFPVWTIQEGESAYECIERAARQRGVLLLSDGRGGLILGKAGTRSAGTVLEVGQNLLVCGVSNNGAQRYQQYVVKGQRAGNDDAFGTAVSAMKATATDPGVARRRTLVVMAEDEADAASLKRRAEWEATVRAARALTVKAAVQGWTHPGGVWAPNTRVRLRSVLQRIDRELLIRDVDLIADERGTRAEMVLTPPEAYTLLARPARKKAPRRGRDDEMEDLLS